LTKTGMNRILVPPAEGTGAALPTQPRPERRLNLGQEQADAGLARLVLTLVELLRQLLEREALRRVDRGTLTLEEMERLGTAFMLLHEKVHELREIFGLREEDLNIDLGPLGRVL
jgi:hypothetical protein